MNKIQKILISAAAGALMFGSLAVGAFASTEAIYNNIPNPTPGNLPSEAFEAQSASEFGGQIMFAGTVRTDPKVTVLMSSWGCESGHWTSGDCLTTPGSTFSVPVTLNVYNVNGDNSVGSLLTTKTQTFDIPYRPSADHLNCPGVAQNIDSNSQGGKWFDGTTCYNGFATPITFDLAGTTLPDKVIVSVAFNTSDYGPTPLRPQACNSTPAGCGYDSLNVALSSPPSVGSDPLPNDAYLYSTWSGAYCSGATGTFRLDSGCWTGYQPAIKVDVSVPDKVLVGKATGGLTLKNPRQQISFNAFDYGASNLDEGNVEYQNFDYAGGLHYTANLLCVNVKKPNEAWFMFQVPDLGNIYVVSYVKDGGSPGTKDTYGHTSTSNLATALSWCETGTVSVTNYTTTGGNAVVHK